MLYAELCRFLLYGCRISLSETDAGAKRRVNAK